DPKTTCRKCRFDRCCFVIASCSRGNSMEDIQKDVVVKSRSNSAVRATAPTEITPSPFLDHETALFADSSCTETPTLERMKRAYGVLCMMRKNGEMGTCSTQTFDQFQRGTIEFSLITYTTNVPNQRIMYVGLLDFFASSFDDFRKLSKEEQRILVYTNFDLFNKIDNLYRSIHHFPEDDTIMPSYTTTFNVNQVDEFLKDSPPNVNREEAAKEMVRQHKRNIIANKAHFLRVQPTGEEFLALIGLALWNDHSSIDDDKIAETVSKNRAIIMAELHKYYAIRGRSYYADRLGDVLCLLVNIEEAATQQKEDDKVYSL
ncbi:hypothetical protein PENTCL1PPCAC_29043, partial [Pristionchus entomophagus]